MSDADFWQAPASNIPVVNADGNIFEETQLATNGQTVFTLATFTYTPATHSIFVWKNGTMLRRGVDYTETSSTKITAATGAALNDKFTFVAFAIQQIIPPIVFNGMPAGGTTGQRLAKNSGSDYDVSWQDSSTQTTLLDAPRQNIASASTVNLGAIAAQTRNIQITGSTQIDGFQVSNGQLWVVRFAAALILKNNANIITQSGADISVAAGDTCFVRATADNVVEVIGYSRSSLVNIPRIVNDFRLTLSSGVPVPTADVTAASNIYLTPYTGNEISLYDGSNWSIFQSAEKTLALAGLSFGKCYDVFAFISSGAVALEFLVWTDYQSRATPLIRQDGVLVKSGDPTRRYLGTFYALTATTTEDNLRTRYLWNNYNRVIRPVTRQEPAVTWTYSLAVVRQANANPLNQIEIVAGLQEDAYDITVVGAALNSAGGLLATTLIGVDNTAAPVARSAAGRAFTNTGTSVQGTAQYRDTALLGMHQISWLELAVASGTTTWSGTAASNPFTGMFGLWRC